MKPMKAILVFYLHYNFGSVYLLVKTALGTDTEKSAKWLKKTASNFSSDQKAERPYCGFSVAFGVLVEREVGISYSFPRSTSSVKVESFRHGRIILQWSENDFKSRISTNGDYSDNLLMTIFLKHDKVPHNLIFTDITDFNKRIIPCCWNSYYLLATIPGRCAFIY